MKNWKKELIANMMNAGNYFFLRQVANDMGIRQISRQDVEGIISAYLSQRPNMTAYYDGGDKNLNSLFCGIWFADKSIEFEDYEEVTA